MTVSLGQALAWRLDRHYLLSGASSVTEVVRRLCSVPAWSGDPDLAIRRRLEEPTPAVVQRAVDDGDLIKTYAFRGATHLMTAEDAGVYLAVRSANRQWELPSWQSHYGLQPGDWPALRESVREALVDGPIGHAELIDAVTANPRFDHLRPGLSGASHTLLKPFAWQGDMCIGPMREGQLTFQACETSPRWTGLPSLDEAGPRAVLAYLAGYGPTTRANLHYWLVAGLSAGRRRLDGWLDELIGDGIVEIEVDGEPLLHLHEYADDLAAHSPNDGVTLLPGHDQWVLGAGTADARIVPPGRRASVTRGANLVLRAGVVSGTWTIAKSQLAVSWFSEAGNPQPARLEIEAHRLAGLLGADLNVSIAIS